MLNQNEWCYVEDRYPPNYKRVLITVLNDEGERETCSGKCVREYKNAKRGQIKIAVESWIYDSDSIFITSGTLKECSKPIAWKDFPEPCGARQ